MILHANLVIKRVSLLKGEPALIVTALGMNSKLTLGMPRGDQGEAKRRVSSRSQLAVAFIAHHRQ